jgi:hypothetical protein
MILDQTITPLDSRAAARAARHPQIDSETIDLGRLEALIGFHIHLLDLLMYQMYYERFGKAAMTRACSRPSPPSRPIPAYARAHWPMRC